jgi:acyl-CoA dehydrogenase
MMARVISVKLKVKVAEHSEDGHMSNGFCFEHSATTREWLARVDAFMRTEVEPREPEFQQTLLANTQAGKRWTPIALLEPLKVKAKQAGLWNLFLPDSEQGAGLTNLEYAPLAERMGHVLWASEVFNCSAPDTGNMEVLARYGTPEQQRRWLKPLLAGEIRSAFAMTEPAASR